MKKNTNSQTLGVLELNIDKMKSILGGIGPIDTNDGTGGGGTGYPSSPPPLS